MRKFCMVIYFLAVVLLVGAWAAYWFGIDPVAGALDAVGGELWFNIALIALIAIVALGSLLLLLRSLFTRSKSSYEESSNEFGSVLVSRDTIEQTAEDVVMQHPEVRSLKTKARLVNRKNPYADITARVAPRGVIPFASVAPVIQSEVKTSVEHLTGNRVRKVVIDVRKNHNPDDLMSSEEEAVMQKRIAAFAAGEARPIDVIPCPVERKLGTAQEEAPEEADDKGNEPLEESALAAEPGGEAVAAEADESASQRVAGDEPVEPSDEPASEPDADASKAGGSAGDGGEGSVDNGEASGATEADAPADADTDAGPQDAPKDAAAEEGALEAAPSSSHPEIGSVEAEVEPVK